MKIRKMKMATARTSTVTERTTLYHRTSTGAVEVWMLSRTGSTVKTTWGLLGGKLQTTTEICLAKGRGGDRPSMDDGPEAAKRLYDRKILLKVRRGWVTEENGVRDKVEVSSTEHANLFVQLPTSFAPAKPSKRPVDLPLVKRQHELGLIGIQRKRDGERYHLVSDANRKIRVYTSGKNDVTEKFAELLEGFRLPPCTILDCEFAITNPDDRQSDNFKWVNKIARALPERGRQTINDAIAAGLRLHFHVFDILWCEGESVYEMKYISRWGLIGDVLARQHNKSVRVRRIPFIEGSFDQALLMLQINQWEGYVLWRLDQGSVVRLDGVPERVNSQKLKIPKEDDVIATGFNLGKGRNIGTVGSLKLAIPGPSGLVPMGNSGGMTDDEKDEALHWTYPCVVQIEYDSKSEKGFRFPKFIRKRDDKTVADVTKEWAL